MEGSEAVGIERSQARFERLYDECAAAILGYALRRTTSPADAADVMANTFLVAWRRLEDVPEGDRAKLWLYGTARRVLANHHRSQRRQNRLLSRLAANVGRELADYVAEARTDLREESELGDLRLAFERLREPDREVLALVAWEGLSTAEIARVLHCTTGAARVKLHRARRRFVVALNDVTAGGGAGDCAGPPAQEKHEEDPRGRR